MMCKLCFLDHLIIFDCGLSWNHENVTKEISTNDLSSTNGILACGLVFPKTWSRCTWIYCNRSYDSYQNQGSTD